MFYGATIDTKPAFHTRMDTYSIQRTAYQPQNAPRTVIILHREEIKPDRRYTISVARMETSLLYNTYINSQALKDAIDFFLTRL